jgi:DNA-binding beta-propeller fold protein YncE
MVWEEIGGGRSEEVDLGLVAVKNEGIGKALSIDVGGSRGGGGGGVVGRRQGLDVRGGKTEERAVRKELGQGRWERLGRLCWGRNGNLLMATNVGVVEMDEEGRVMKTIGGEEGPGKLQYASGAAVGEDGKVYVCDFGKHCVNVYGADGGFERSFGSAGSGPGQLQNPSFMCISRGGDVYVSEWSGNRISVFSREGVFLRTIGKAGSGAGEFQGPRGVGIDEEAGHLYVADWKHKRVQVFELDGTFVRMFARDWKDGPFALSVDVEARQVLVTDCKQLTVWSMEGVYQGSITVSQWDGILQDVAVRDDGRIAMSVLAAQRYVVGLL